MVSSSHVAREYRLLGLELPFWETMIRPFRSLQGNRGEGTTWAGDMRDDLVRAHKGENEVF